MGLGGAIHSETPAPRLSQNSLVYSTNSLWEPAMSQALGCGGVGAWEELVLERGKTVVEGRQGIRQKTAAHET